MCCMGNWATGSCNGLGVLTVCAAVSSVMGGRSGLRKGGALLDSCALTIVVGAVAGQFQVLESKTIVV